MDSKSRKRVVCYRCGKEGKMTYNITKHKWVRKYKCPKCGSGSFQWYNF